MWSAATDLTAQHQRSCLEADSACIYCVYGLYFQVLFSSLFPISKNIIRDKGTRLRNSKRKRKQTTNTVSLLSMPVTPMKIIQL